MPIWKPKRTMISEDFSYGVCLWRLPNGAYIQDSDQNYLCAQAKLYDPGTERKMRAAAKSLGITEGEPFWMPGFRQISRDEWEDQMADLLDGGIPDPVDIYRQVEHGD